jgi:hypothetical protein
VRDAVGDRTMALALANRAGAGLPRRPGSTRSDAWRASTKSNGCRTLRPQGPGLTRVRFHRWCRVPVSLPSR